MLRRWRVVAPRARTFGLARRGALRPRGNSPAPRELGIPYPAARAFAPRFCFQVVLRISAKCGRPPGLDHRAIELDRGNRAHRNGPAISVDTAPTAFDRVTADHVAQLGNGFLPAAPPCAAPVARGPEPYCRCRNWTSITVFHGLQGRAWIYGIFFPLSVASISI